MELLLLILPHPGGKEKGNPINGNIPKEFSPVVFIRSDVGSLSPAMAST